MPKNYRVYRPNSNNNGSATEWQLSYKENEKYDKFHMFLVGANQTGTDDNGNAQFNWKETKLNVKLGEADIGEFLAVLSRRKDSIYTKGTMFHNTPGGGNKVVGFSRNVERGGYSLSISAQDKDKQSTGKIMQIVSDADAEILLVLLRLAVERIYGW